MCKIQCCVKRPDQDFSTPIVFLRRECEKSAHMREGHFRGLFASSGITSCVTTNRTGVKVMVAFALRSDFRAPNLKSFPEKHAPRPPIFWVHVFAYLLIPISTHGHIHAVWKATPSANGVACESRTSLKNLPPALV